MSVRRALERLSVRLLLLLTLIAGAAFAQPMAAIRLTHLSPDAPQFDLVIDRQLFMRDISYGQVTPYSSLPAGQHEISVFPHRLPDTPGDEADEGPQMLEPITILVNLEDGMYYTLAISGFYERTALAADSGSLAVDVEPSEASVAVTGPRGYSESFRGDRALSELEPGTYTIRAEYQDHQPATLEITVQPNETSAVSITLQEGEGGPTQTSPRPGTEGTAPAWRPIELHVFRDELSIVPPPGGSRIRLVHLAPATTSVDLLAIPADGGGEPIILASDLTFPNGTAYARLPGRLFTLQVRLAGTDAILTQVRDVTIRAGGVYTLFLVREPADNYLRLIPAVDMLLSVRR
ncbi:MAG: DUF4397 domain-containing protein [Trueperaceae bacterium]